MSATLVSETSTHTKRVSRFTPQEILAMVLSALTEQSEAAGYQVQITPEPSRIMIEISGATIKDGYLTNA